MANTGSVIGFGSNFAGVNVSDATLNLGVGSLLDYAFVAPRDGVITSISAFFSTTAAVTLLSTVTVQAQVYLADANSSSFTPVGTPLSLTPAIGPVIAIGTNRSATMTTSIPVTTGQKILLVFSSSTGGVDLASSVAGFASAGITIS